jgi:ESCRT-I complex subunit TSG101
MFQGHSSRILLSVLERISSVFLLPSVLKTDIKVHEDGRSELLLCIEGLLPIRYRNHNYKIPVAIWIPQDYPQSPPMVFVTPKKDMIVKQSRNVDPNGKCYHPNLANWSNDPNVLPLISFLSNLTRVCITEQAIS